MAKGLFITLEGGEGSGKTTQIKRIASMLAERGHEVISTREPGGTPDAEKIRDLLVRRDGGNWTPMAECLLLFAARALHADMLIRPAIDDGKIVICDRFTDSTRAYQAYGHGLALSTVEEINRVVLGDFKPDLTFILDIPVEAGLERAGWRLREMDSIEDRFEKLDISFHKRLRQGFLSIAEREPERCIVIDAAKDVDEVAGELAESILRKLEARKPHAVR